MKWPHLWHRWSHWTTELRHRFVRFNEGKPGEQIAYQAQRRTCTVCGKVQIVEVRP